MPGSDSKLSGFSISATFGFALRMTDPVWLPPTSATLTTIRGRGSDERTYTVRVVLDPRGMVTVIVRQSVPGTHVVSGMLALSGRKDARPVPFGGPSAGWFDTMN